MNDPHLLPATVAPRGFAPVTALLAATTLLLLWWAVRSADTWMLPLAVLVTASLGWAALAHFWLQHRLRTMSARLRALDGELADYDRLSGSAVDAPVSARAARITRRLQRLGKIEQGLHGLEAQFDRADHLVWISPAVEAITGYTPAECLAATDIIDLLVYEHDRGYGARVAKQVLGEGGTQTFEMRFNRRDGSQLWMACHMCRVGDGAGVPFGLHLSAVDIQDRKDTEFKLLETVAELRRSQSLREIYLERSNDERNRLTGLLNIIRLGILVLDRDNRVQYYNRPLLELWNIAPEENLIGARESVLHERFAQVLALPERYFAQMRTRLVEGGASSGEDILLRDGRVLIDSTAMIEGGPDEHSMIGRLWVYEDVTDARNTAQRLVEIAERDPLTNLYNRRRFVDDLRRTLALAARSRHQAGLLMFDLDGFKPVNDTFGHLAGDQVLVRVAQAVSSIIRMGETLFRLGGDEFAVIVPEAEHSALTELARRIVLTIRELDFEFEGVRAGVTASLGVAVFPDHLQLPDNPGAGHPATEALLDQWIDAADAALYRSKDSGRNCWTLASPMISEPTTLDRSQTS